MAAIHLNVVQVAESLGVEESVVGSWVRHEGLPCVRDSGRLIFDREQVAAWATERGMAARAGFLAPAASASASDLDLCRLLRNGGIWRGVAPSDVRPAIAQAVQNLPGASPEICRMLVQRVLAPGGITWAPVGRGIALPHMRSRVSLGKDSGMISVIFLKENLRLNESPDEGVDLDRLLFFVAPTPRSHLAVLAGLSAALTRGGFADRLQAGLSDGEICEALESCSRVASGAKEATR